MPRGLDYDDGDLAHFHHRGETCLASVLTLPAKSLASLILPDFG